MPRTPDAGNLPVRFDEGGLNVHHHDSSAAKKLSPLLYLFVVCCSLCYCGEMAWFIFVTHYSRAC